jgi:hypothetical protein
VQHPATCAPLSRSGAVRYWPRWVRSRPPDSTLGPCFAHRSENRGGAVYLRSAPALPAGRGARVRIVGGHDGRSEPREYARPLFRAGRPRASMQAVTLGWARLARRNACPLALSPGSPPAACSPAAVSITPTAPRNEPGCATSGRRRGAGARARAAPAAASRRRCAVPWLGGVHGTDQQRAADQLITVPEVRGAGAAGRARPCAQPHRLPVPTAVPEPAFSTPTATWFSRSFRGTRPRPSPCCRPTRRCPLRVTSASRRSSGTRLR